MSFFWGYFWYLMFMYMGDNQEVAMFIGVLVSIMVAKNAIIEAIRRK